jgi:hypothetical protein
VQPDHKKLKDQRSFGGFGLYRFVASYHCFASISAWNELVTSGISFMENLGRAISQMGHDKEKGLSALVEKDRNTGQQYLKIPIQDERIFATVSKVLGSLIGIFRSSSTR